MQESLLLVSLGRVFGWAGAHRAHPSTAGGAVGFSDLSPEAAGWVTLTTRLLTALQVSLSWVRVLGVLRSGRATGLARQSVWVTESQGLCYFFDPAHVGSAMWGLPFMSVHGATRQALSWILCASSRLVPGPGGSHVSGQEWCLTPIPLLP